MTTRLEKKKKYIAESLEMAMLEFRRDLGEAGIIESINEVKEGGILGFFAHRKFVIVAGVPEEKSKTNQESASQGDGKVFLESLLSANPGLKPTGGYSISAKNGVDNEKLKDILNGLKNEALKKNATATAAVNIGSSPAVATQNYKYVNGLSRKPQTNKDSGVAESLTQERQTALDKTIEAVRNGTKLPSNTKKAVTAPPPKLTPQVKAPVVEANEDLRTEVLKMREAISDLSLKMQTIHVVQSANSGPEISVKPPLETKEERNFKALAVKLREYDFDEAVIETYMHDLKNHAFDSASDFESLQTVLKNRVMKTLNIKDSVFDELSRNQKRPRVMVFVGPTGVGKTTTIAKLAEGLHSRGHKVALITLDTYKVGALDQMREYAGLLDIPLEVVWLPEDIQTTLDLHSDKDVLLIDTMGRTQRDVAFTDLKLFLKDRFRELEVETHLCLAANTKHRDMVESIRAFNHLNVDCLLFTKLDETFSFGPILSVLQRSTKKISYITNGQAVPGNYKVIDRDFLASLMFRRSL